ncbi:transcriptional regulator [Paenibacillus xylanilyticus]|uniref:Transcriptional regulator n=2 Tax=Paenibacillus xylanilyticus TaxID=248903 RepID=A0A7Y6C308_9BACL|nr:transcriptional regulator [Paenibacillus xylanilyticus]
MASLHTYICRKSHKKIDLSPSWAQETEEKLSSELVDVLKDMKVDDDWKWMYLLVCLRTEAEQPESFIDWFRQLAEEELENIFARYSFPYPDDLSAYRSKMLYVLTEWNRQYFRLVDQSVLQDLQQEAQHRSNQLNFFPQEEVLDDATNGLMFRPINGLERVLLVPQFHFQPLNVILSFGDTIVCHYASRIYTGDQEYIPTHHLRVIRSLGEKNRLKILRYLTQGPRSFIEIVRHLKLSKGITHDHLSKLRGAGLVYAHFEGESLVEYTLRPRALEQILPNVLKYLEQ